MAQLSSSLGAVTKATAKAQAGAVRSVSATNANAATRYLQVFDQVAAPAGTNVPALSFPLPPGSAGLPSTVVLDHDFFGADGLAFESGIGWAVSTTAATFTDSATAADHSVALIYS